MDKRRNKLKLSIAVISLLFIFIISCKNEKKEQVTVTNDSDTSSAKITFVELGSVNCIPCRQMQPVMKSIEEKYNGQVKVVFHDVWKDKKPAQEYGIQLIPTQVFLDENGKEFFRHEGFFAENEIIELFAAKGVVPIEK
jgi:thioredoxin 1